MTRPVPWPVFPAGMLCAFVRMQLHHTADPVPNLVRPPPADTSPAQGDGTACMAG
jgi:hypothetical protein